MKKIIERLLKTTVGKIIVRELYISLIEAAEIEAMNIKNPTGQVAVIAFLNALKEGIYKDIDTIK